MKLIFFKKNQAAVKESTLASMGPNCPHPGQGRDRGWGQFGPMLAKVLSLTAA